MQKRKREYSEEDQAKNESKHVEGSQDSEITFDLLRTLDEVAK